MELIGRNIVDSHLFTVRRQPVLSLEWTGATRVDKEYAAAFAFNDQMYPWGLLVQYGIDMRDGNARSVFTQVYYADDGQEVWVRTCYHDAKDQRFHEFIKDPKRWRKITMTTVA